jgi:hypothetical protein
MNKDNALIWINEEGFYMITMELNSFWKIVNNSKDALEELKKGNDVWLDEKEK